MARSPTHGDTAAMNGAPGSRLCVDGSYPRFQDAGEEVDDFGCGVALAVAAGLEDGPGVAVLGGIVEGRVVAVDGVRLGGVGLGDAGKFVLVEPVQAAGLAGVHHHVAAADVEVGLHRVMAVGAVDLAVEFVDVGGLRGDGRAGGAGRVD